MAQRTVELDTIEDVARRPDLEKELGEKYHVSFSYSKQVAPGQFDAEKSLHNQARFDPLDEKTVGEYADAVERGDTFPAVVAYRPGGAKRKLVIVDGNHRLAAHMRHGRGLAVYELAGGTDPRTIALLTFALNTRHGRPTTEAERVSQAVYLVDNGASQDQAAAAVNLSPRILKRALARQSGDRRADEVGLRRNEWDSLAPSVRARLAATATDEGFRAVAELAFAARLDANEAFELVGRLNATKSSARQVELVKHERDALADRIQAGAGGVLTSSDRRAATPKTYVSRALGQLAALPESDDVIVSAYAAPERDAAAERLRATGERLLRIAERLRA